MAQDGYNQHEVNHRILKKYSPRRSDCDFLGPYDKYGDENRRIYETKCQQFEACAKNYNRLNQNVLIHNRPILLEERDDELTYDFLEENEEEYDQQHDNFPNEEKPVKKPIYLRKRSFRKANQTFENRLDVCCIEPWNVRYLILGKFVQAARTVLVHCRMMRNLERLKLVKKSEVDEVDEYIKQFERKEPQYNNVAYAELFDKFINK